MRRRALLWVFLFVFAVVTLVLLAAFWNFILVEVPSLSPRITGMVLGTLGFVFILVTAILFLVRLLGEMRLSQLQRDFLGHVSHELKTPLATLELSSQLLARRLPSSDPQVAELWTEHARELSRLRSQVETLLSAARLDTVRKKRIDLHPIEIDAWLESQLPRWSQLLGPDAVLKLDGKPTGCRIEANDELLRSGFENLIDNARKFAKGPAHVVITRARPTPETWSITVVDRGWGFPPEDRKRLFHRFYRTKQPRGRARVGGTGLGLWITRNAFRAMGMTIEAMSRGTGTGATFTVRGPNA